MNLNQLFRSFKQKVLLENFLKASLFALMLGAFSVFVTSLVYHILIRETPLMLVCAIGGGVFAIAFILLFFIRYPDESIKSVSTANDYATVVAEEVGIYTAVMTTADGGEYVDFFVHIPDGEVTSTSGGTLEIEINTNSDIEAEQAISEIWFWIVLMMLLLILVEWGWYYHELY